MMPHTFYVRRDRTGFRHILSIDDGSGQITFRNGYRANGRLVDHVCTRAEWDRWVAETGATVIEGARAASEP